MPYHVPGYAKGTGMFRSSRIAIKSSGRYRKSFVNRIMSVLMGVCTFYKPVIGSLG